MIKNRGCAMQVSGSPYTSAGFSARYRPKASVAQENAPKPIAPVDNISEINQDQQRQLQILKDRDREVRNHEQAHLSAAGGLAVSGASFQFATGPDRQRYAVGGEVSIDTSAVANDPAATLRKAEMIRRAALAPVQPSAQDYNVANRAAAMANKARVDLLRDTPDFIRTGSRVNIRA
ncbi:putative metalloprotease CJM1_0395 family protein [Methylomonas sp. MgM2]